MYNEEFKGKRLLRIAYALNLNSYQTKYGATLVLASIVSIAAPVKVVAVPSQKQTKPLSQLQIKPLKTKTKPSQSSVDWYAIEKKVSDQVVKKGLQHCLADDRKRGSVIKLLPLLEKISLYSRAGEDSKLEDAINKLAKIKPLPSKHLLSNIADSLIDRKHWQLSRKFLSLFPQAEPGWGYVMIRQWRGAKPSSEDISKIDRWIAAQMSRAPQSDFWFREKLRFKGDVGGLKPLFSKMKADIKNNPSNLKISLRYVNAFKSYRSYLKPPPDISWLSQVAKPMDAYDSMKFGEALQVVAPKTAIYFYKRSLDLAFTKSDRTKMEHYMRHCTAMLLPPQNHEKLLRGWAKAGLARAYQKTGASVQAQKILLQLSRENKGKSSMPFIAMSQLAGRVQAYTPQKPLEKQIKRAEKENKNSADYWIGRARYYQGRKDNTKVEEAYRKALSLTKFKGDDKQKIFARILVVSGYEGYIYNNVSKQKALTFLWNEFDQHPELDYQKRLLDLAWHHGRRYIKPENERVWSYLKRVPKWDYTEEHILWAALQNSKNGDRDWQRAEALTQNAHWSKASVLGWVMTRSQRSKRSIPLLKQALSGVKKKEDRQRVSFTLFEAYLKINDWQGAKSIWSLARERLTPREISDWAGQIALAAAKVGEKKEALSLWKEKDEIDRSDLRNLENLARNGLKTELESYYKGLLKKSSGADYAKTALKVLAKVN